MEKQFVNAIIIAVVLVLVLIAFYTLRKVEEPNRALHAELAQCLKDNGAVFYGAFWCPHCAEQKGLFQSKSAQALLPYIECSTADQKDQTQVCKNEKIVSYPTWKFANGFVCPTLLRPELLAYLSECSSDFIPSGEKSGETVYDLFIAESLEKLRGRAGGQEDVTIDPDKIAQEHRDAFDTRLTQEYGTTVATATAEQVLSVFAGETCVTADQYQQLTSATNNQPIEETSPEGSTVEQETNKVEESDEEESILQVIPRIEPVFPSNQG